MISLLYVSYKLLFLILFLSVVLLIHNKYKNNLFTQINLVFLIFLVAALNISGIQEFILFFVSGIIYFGLDTLAVYKNHWRYNTKSGYVLWAGPGWGLATLVIFRLADLAHLSFIFLLLFVTLLLISKRLKKELKLSHFSQSYWLPFALISLVLNPSLFLISLCVGIILEYISVEIFKAWKYDNLVFTLIGIGYGTFMVFVNILISFIQGERTIFNVFFLVSLLLVSIFTKIYTNKLKEK